MARLSSPAASNPRGKALQRTLIDDRDDSSLKTELWLTVVEQKESRMMPMPESGELSIGRAEDSDIILDNPSVSRNHAVLRIVNGAVSVQDMGSANGTRIGGKRLPPDGEGPVPPGVAILIAGASLVVHQLASAQSFERPGREGNSAVREVIMATEHIRALKLGKKPSDSPYGDLVVESTAMRKLFELVDRIAPGTIAVLLTGETGVGKEVVAAAIHDRSPRRFQPYLRLNCSAFAENLLESELFGHEAGAFSGARAAKPGLFETANGGTVLLDEIGEMPMAIQAKLLRVIETREVIPLGGTRVRKLDVRFISATNRELRERIRKGLFREDLYFRLSGVSVEVPPLRTRRSEIAPLARLFAAEAAEALGRKGVPDLAADALLFLEEQPWPGNVRELRNCVERAVLICNSNTLTVADIDPNRETSLPRKTQKPMQIVVSRDTDTSESAELEQVQEALSLCAGNQTRAAALLGIARR
ncbi:MAG TPA: sigma 54-interacting transcriptional regulator, partial [Polyangia bacterium]